MSRIEKGIAIIKGSKFLYYGSGKLPRLRGKCKIVNKGRLTIGKSFSVAANQIPVNITVENKNAELIIGENVYINYGVDIGCSSKITIGDNVKIGPLTNIIDNNYHQIDINDKVLSKPIMIGNNVWIGRGCIILPGIEIGDNAVIAAGSVVTKNVETNTLIGGSPAKVIRKLEIIQGWLRT